MAGIERTPGELQKNYEKLVTMLPSSSFDRRIETKTLCQVLRSIAGKEFLNLLERSPHLLSALQGDGSE